MSECEVCGSTFATETAKKIHKTKMGKHGPNNTDVEKIVCENCGDEVPKKDKWGNKRTTYCSAKCHQNAGGNHIECDNCGKEFQRKPSHVQENNNYCSEECLSEGRKGRYSGKKTRITETLGKKLQSVAIVETISHTEFTAKENSARQYAQDVVSMV